MKKTKIHSDNIRGHTLMAGLIMAAILLAGCGKADTAGEVSDTRAAGISLADQLNVLCQGRVSGAVESQRITASQAEHACECFRDSFSDLEETELRNVVEYELAVQSGKTANIPAENRPSLQAMAAMQDANACLTPAAIEARG